MRTIASFSPAESLLILKRKQTTVAQLLKVTLMDLLLKKVLIQNSKEGESSDFTISRGPNFESYSNLPHEDVFLSAIRRKGDISLRTLINMVSANAGFFNQYTKKFFEMERFRLCFQSGIVRFFAGRFQRSIYGEKVFRQLSQEVEDLEAMLPDLMQTHPAAALEVLKEIGGNVFILKRVDFKLMTEIEKEFVLETNAKQTRQTSTFDDPIFWFWLTMDWHGVSNSSTDSSWTDSDASSAGDWGDSGADGGFD
jgi:hypothetical protein